MALECLKCVQGLCLALALLLGSAQALLPPRIPIAAIFNQEQDSKHELAFKYGVERINKDPSILSAHRLVPEIVKVPAGNSFMAELKTCALLEKGVAAIFGPQSDAGANHIKAIIDTVEIPFIDTRWNYRPYQRFRMHDGNSEYTMNMHPDVEPLGQAYIDLIVKYGWTSITILYQDNDSMMRLKGIFDRTALFTDGFRIITKELKKTEENGYRDVLREVYVSKATNIILDCTKDVTVDVLKQAQQVGMVSEEYFYLITSLDTHTVDMEDFKHGGTNFTTFRLVDTNRDEVQSVIKHIVNSELEQGRTFNFRDGQLDTDTALIYDSVTLFALALDQINKIQDVSIVPLSCSGQRTWDHGSSLVNYMKLMEFEGLSGKVSFDTQGLRSQFYLDVLELQATGLESVGTWNPGDSLNLTRIIEPITNDNPLNVMANKTFVVFLVQGDPYTMLTEKTEKQVGNNRFEGFSIDLMDAIANLLHFNITYKLVPDGEHGRVDEHGNWNGLIKGVMDGPENDGCDFGIGDLSITRERAEAVPFTMPFMNLGISIVFIKPRQAPPSLLSFLSPFTLEVWIYTAIFFVVVSVFMFILARFSPYEWDNPYPCIEEPEEYENQFSLANSFWFTIGSLMQQGSDVAPTALSTRLLAGMWFFFALIMIASYTANLAAFLTVETLEKPLESAEDLVKQNIIKFGSLKSGSTKSFFENSNIYPFNEMWKVMEENFDDVMVKSNEEGIERVIKEDGKYAYLMESTSISYRVERKPCKLAQIGGNLDNKGYGIPMSPGAPYKPLMDGAILALQEGGELFRLKNKWWKQKRGGGACQDKVGGGGVSELGLDNVAGVFIVTVLGCVVATVLAFVEFFLGTKQQAEDLGTTWASEMRHELRFALQCHGSTKQVRKPLTNEASSGSSSSSSSGSDRASLAFGSGSGSRSSLSLEPPGSSISRGLRPGSASSGSKTPGGGGSSGYGETGNRNRSHKSPSNHYGRTKAGRAGNPFEEL